MAPDASERIEWSRPSELPGVEILLGERTARRWRWYHETYSICTVLDLSGEEVEWTYRRKLHSTKAGGLLLMEPGEVHANTRPTRSADFRVAFIAPSLVEEAATELGMVSPRPHLKFAYVNDPGLFQAFAQFHATLENGSSSLERESSFVTCVRLLLRQCTETSSPAFKQSDRSALLRARDLIREHYSRSITLDELVAATGLSRYHLVRAFAKEIGLPPHAYQIHVQVERARSLLAAGFPPAVVAAETGFADQSHFTRHFKRTNGVTPGEYLRGGNAGRRTSEQYR